MHDIKTTKGLIIGSRPVGEADKIVSLLTEDFGLISASAKAVRLERSKLRYGLQDYCLGTFSLVRGREFWRLVGVERGGRLRPIENSRIATLVGRLCSLLKRLLQGEEANKPLFVSFKSIFDFLENNPDISDQRLTSLESLAVLRILERLGYVGELDYLDGAERTDELTVQVLDGVSSKRKKINGAINAALKESHL